MQYADSFFPAGGIAFSWGLEQLRRDGEVQTGDDLAGFIEGQLRFRWATFDAAVLCAAWRAGNEPDRAEQIDRAVDAMTLAEKLRDGSRRGGASLLSVHGKLGNAAAQAYRPRVSRRTAPGHLAVVQAMVWRASGVELEVCRAMSAHLLLTGLVSAGVRLGLIGHLNGQTILVRLRPLVCGLLTQPAPELEHVLSCTPASDIACMRHEVADARLFAN